VWSAGSERVDVYLACGRIGVRGGAEPQAWKVFDAPIGDFQRLAGEVAAIVQGRKKVRLWLSGELARPFLFGPVAGLHRWAEVERVLEAAAPEASGLDGPCRVWIDGDPTRQACVAVAVPVALVEALAAAKREKRLAAVSVRPWWSAALNAVLASEPAAQLVVVDDHDALTVLQGGAGQYQGASTGWPHPGGQLDQWLARQQVVHAADPAATIYCALSPPAAHSAGGPRQLVNVPFGATMERQA
jgi:hypothetical protein